MVWAILKKDGKIFGKTLEEMRSEIKEELTNNKEEVIEKLDYVLELLKKEKEKHNVNEENHKDRINKAFEKKQIDRPVGSWEDKRKQYLEWINQGKIAEPKDQTLMYYKIKYDEKTQKYKFWDKEEFDYTR